LKNVSEIIEAEIQAFGALPFARFMELALYCPGSGYYEKERDTIGRGGDFYTSVSVGGLFGQLLAFQFADWFDAPGAIQRGGHFQIVEAGAHDGRLAEDIMGWFRDRRPDALESLEYCILEPSAFRRSKQEEMLREFKAKTRWVSGFDQLADGVRGVIFSNELLDSFPIHRWVWDAKERAWFEQGVTCEGNRFVWCRLPNPEPGDPAQAGLLDVLPDGYIMESSAPATQWYMDALRTLRSGKILTIDYGYEDGDFPSPTRLNGTVRAYRHHKLVSDVLANPGEQDITAHVNFGMLRALGMASGLRTEARESQAVFLTDIARRAWEKGSSFGPWTAKQSRQFFTLTHPEHLGRAFRALVQAR
jgi:SAM-dependent MidA family methyltransferase